VGLDEGENVSRTDPPVGVKRKSRQFSCLFEQSAVQ